MRSHTRTSKTRRNDGKKKKSLALLLFLIGGVFVIHYVIDQVRDDRCFLDGSSAES